MISAAGVAAVAPGRLSRLAVCSPGGKPEKGRGVMEGLKEVPDGEQSPAHVTPRRV